MKLLEFVVERVLLVIHSDNLNYKLEVLVKVDKGKSLCSLISVGKCAVCCKCVCIYKRKCQYHIWHLKFSKLK